MAGITYMDNIMDLVTVVVIVVIALMVTSGIAKSLGELLAVWFEIVCREVCTTSKEVVYATNKLINKLGE